MSRCATHKNARAAWVCASCDKTLCPDCAFARSIKAEEIAICVHCGGLGRLITRPRRIAPFWEMFPKFLGAIFSVAGLVQLVAIALIQYLVSWIPLFGGFVSFFIYVSYYFRVISSASGGAERLPEPDDFLGFGSMLAPVFRFVLATTLIWLPAASYLLWGIGPQAIFEDPRNAYSDPVLILLIVGGILYFPAAIIAAAIAESALAVINPLITIRLILRIPGQYVLATAIWGVLTVVNLVVIHAVTLACEAFWVPIITPVLLNTLALVVPVFNGFILGRLIYQNHEHFGVMRLGAADEPEWPDARPRAQVDPSPHARSGEPGAQKPVEAIEIDFSDSPAPPDAFMSFRADLPARPAAPLELDPSTLSGSIDLPSLDTGDVHRSGGLELDMDGNLVGTGDLQPTTTSPPKPPPERLQLSEDVPLLHIGKRRTGDMPAPRPTGDLPAPRPASNVASPPIIYGDELVRLKSALDRGDEKAALELFRLTAVSGSYPDLDPRQNLRLAGVLERAAEFEEAVRACQRAAKADMKGPFAAKAIFTAARIMADRAGNPSGARAMYEYLLKTFPQDELASRAREALKRL